ncbi:MAG TPA: VWA domain-containing protein, partial [Thermoanaerobaculia bacterium]|nr:VWA domain-containing protein [Thermoanaerobaculia bacterium]
VFGDFEVEVAVRPAGASLRVLEVYLDGVRAAVLEAPPWRALLQAGQENRQHRIEVLARDAAGRTASAARTTPAIRTDMEVLVELRQLYVRVEDDGRPVLDLGRGDFTVLDGGAVQELTAFARGDAPFTATLLVDASTSMRGARLATALEGARVFAAGMQRLDEAKLLLFSDRLLLETPFTSLGPVLSLPLAQTAAGGGSAVHDTLYLALKRLEARPGRRVVVLLSDGVDVESALPIERVQWAARRSQAVLYWLRLRRPEDDVEPAQVHRLSAWRDAAEHRRGLELLEQAVVESGGRVERLAGTEEVGPALARLLGELRDQYLLGYQPAGGRARTDGWREVRVVVRDPASAGLTVRAPRGYLER